MEDVVKNTTIFLALTEVKIVKKSFLPLLCSVLTEVESFCSPLFDKGATRACVHTLDRIKAKRGVLDLTCARAIACVRVRVRMRAKGGLDKCARMWRNIDHC